MQKLYTVSQAADLIAEKRHVLFVAGSRNALGHLPAGAWIGGTIPYFMDPIGGLCDQERVFVHMLPEAIPLSGLHIESITPRTVREISSKIPRGGFAMLILPAFSEVHTRFAMEAPNWPADTRRPLVGWVSGCHLEELGTVLPEVINGSNQSFMSDHGVIAYVKLPDGLKAETGMVNLFQPGTGARIEFISPGFSVRRARVNEVEVDFAKWCRDRRIDLKLPLVCDCHGTMVNVSFRNLHKDRVDFYAPVFSGMVYRQAASIGDYPTEFSKQAPKGPFDFSCNCILNYLYAELEGRQISVPGPATFGEISERLLNQTLCYLRIQ